MKKVLVIGATGSCGAYTTVDLKAKGYDVVACAPLPSQYAAIEALSGKENYSENMVKIFTSR